MPPGPSKLDKVAGGKNGGGFGWEEGRMVVGLGFGGDGTGGDSGWVLIFFLASPALYQAAHICMDLSSPIEMAGTRYISPYSKLLSSHLLTYAGVLHLACLFQRRLGLGCAYNTFILNSLLFH